MPPTRRSESTRKGSREGRRTDDRTELGLIEDGRHGRNVLCVDTRNFNGACKRRKHVGTRGRGKKRGDEGPKYLALIGKRGYVRHRWWRETIGPEWKQKRAKGGG